MTNEYLEEFKEEVSLHFFLNWLRANSQIFSSNMFSLGEGTKQKELREWVSLFLLFTEYEDNKDLHNENTNKQG